MISSFVSPATGERGGGHSYLVVRTVWRRIVHMLLGESLIFAVVVLSISAFRVFELSLEISSI